MRGRRQPHSPRAVPEMSIFAQPKWAAPAQRTKCWHTMAPMQRTTETIRIAKRSNHWTSAEQFCSNERITSMWVHAGSSVSPATSRHPSLQGWHETPEVWQQGDRYYGRLWNMGVCWYVNTETNLTATVWTITTKPKVGWNIWLATSRVARCKVLFGNYPTLPLILKRYNLKFTLRRYAIIDNHWSIFDTGFTKDLLHLDCARKYCLGIYLARFSHPTSCLLHTNSKTTMVPLSLLVLTRIRIQRYVDSRLPTSLHDYIKTSDMRVGWWECSPTRRVLVRVRILLM